MSKASELLNGAVRFVLPPTEDRIALNLGNAFMAAVPFGMLWFMASLARQPGTYGLRLALAPAVMIYTLRIHFLYFINDPHKNSTNQIFSMPIIVLRRCPHLTNRPWRFQRHLRVDGCHDAL